jgi:hypothetical protein
MADELGRTRAILRETLHVVRGQTPAEIHGAFPALRAAGISPAKCLVVAARKRLRELQELGEQPHE